MPASASCRRRRTSASITSPAGAYPTGISFYDTVPIGGVYVDTTNNTWRSDLVSGRGINFFGINCGDMTDPTSPYATPPGLPTRSLYTGYAGFDDAGVMLDKYQPIMSRDGIITHGVSVLRRKSTFAHLVNDTTATDLASWTIPAYSLRVFDYTPNANVFLWDRMMRLTARGSFKNNIGSAAACTLVVKVYLGSTPIFSTPTGGQIISLAASAFFRTWRLHLEFATRNASNNSFCDAELLIGAADGTNGSGGATAKLSTLATYTQSQSGLTTDLTADQTLRIEMTLGTADSLIEVNLNHARVELV